MGTIWPPENVFIGIKDSEQEKLTGIRYVHNHRLTSRYQLSPEIKLLLVLECFALYIFI